MSTQWKPFLNSIFIPIFFCCFLIGCTVADADSVQIYEVATRDILKWANLSTQPIGMEFETENEEILAKLQIRIKDLPLLMHRKVGFGNFPNNSKTLLGFSVPKKSLSGKVTIRVSLSSSAGHKGSLSVWDYTLKSSNGLWFVHEKTLKGIT